MFAQLNKKDQKLLLEAPAYMSLLAANHDGLLLAKEKKAAIKLAHVKTFSTPLELRDFFIAVDKNFAASLDALDKKLPAGFSARKAVIEKKLLKIKNLLDLMEYNYARQLTQDLNDFLRHVYQTHSNVSEVIALPIFFDYINKSNHPEGNLEL